MRVCVCAKKPFEKNKQVMEKLAKTTAGHNC